MHQEPREGAQVALFREGLRQINVLYAHQSTHVWCLTRVPKDEPRAYHMRGWTTFELRVASLIKHAELLLNLGLLPLRRPALTAAQRKLYPDEDHHLEYFGEEVLRPCVTTRDAPLTPEAFRKTLGLEGEPDAKTFTNGADRGFVAEKYEKTFHEVMGSTEELWFVELDWGDAELALLGRALAHCPQLQYLSLDGNQRITAEGVGAHLLPALAQMPQLRVLSMLRCAPGLHAELLPALQQLPAGLKLEIS
uniref:Uncharacterized protein n=1 Tax=Haptolina brevifila TaxID=156173 RepID=A0A7S2DN19_9EUKA|mmetsp:Transcript_41404/g.83001  ORF Transcript_41404/g.83001 Transcript_41404/m.83001 type:complete len:250 (+) Transcript_41404:791-1540(+)